MSFIDEVRVVGMKMSRMKTSRHRGEGTEPLRERWEIRAKIFACSALAAVYQSQVKPILRCCCNHADFDS
jgi:hypothetical protein